MNEYVELTANGSWYEIECEWDNQLDVFKAHGKTAAILLIEDLIHDAKLDEKPLIVSQLEKMLNNFKK